MAKGDKKYTIKKEFLKALRSKKAAGNVLVACTMINVSRNTVYKYRREDDVFEDKWLRAVRTGRRLIAQEAEHKLRVLITKENITAIIFALKSYKPSIYKERYEHVGKDNEPIKVSMPGVEKWLKSKIKKSHGKTN